MCRKLDISFMAALAPAQRRSCPSHLPVPKSRMGERGCSKPSWGVTPARQRRERDGSDSPANFTCAERGGSPGSREEEEEEEEGRWGE